MVKAQHVETALARGPSGRDVIFRIDLKAAGAGGRVSRPDGLDDALARSEEQSAALGRCGRARVRNEVVVGTATEEDVVTHIIHRASTAMAMPIPPPMHSVAIP